jgi:alpha-tubulin suppressor-like RCC1 family protein
MNTSSLEYNGQPITTAAVVPELTGITALALGEHSCALLQRGQPVCWGFNTYGELGNGTSSNTPTTTPGPVAGLTNVTSIAVGAYHTCASDSKGLAYCWGENNQGQLGFDPQGDLYSPHPNPMVVPGLSGVVSVSVAGYRSCALLETGAVACWGYPTTTLTRIDGIDLTRALALTTGGSSSCAVLADGHVACWGDGTHGAFGDGTKMTSYTSAVVVPSLTSVIDVSLGSRVCALVADRSVSCWGTRTDYSTGITDDDLEPVPVTGL